MSLSSGHNWKLKSFNTITFCDHCGTLLWGICNQGFQCVDCNFSSHSKCTNLVTSFCNHKKKILLERPHQFYKTTKSIGKFCNHCRDTTFTISDDCYVCKDCKYIAHEHCKNDAPNNCRLPYYVDNSSINNINSKETSITISDSNGNSNNNNNNNDQKKQEGPVLYHHWVEGNLKENKKCMECDGICEKAFSLAHYKCLWCSKHLHSKCFNNHNPICDLGPLKDIIIPPTIVHIDDQHQPLKPDTTNTTSNSSAIEEKNMKFKLVSPIPNKALFIFINSKSGGQMGTELQKKFASIVNPIQLIDLIKTGPDPGLLMIKDYLELNPQDANKFRIMVCGGDGTVGWILNAMKKHQLPSIPVGILALGTGNDLSRTFGWGPGYDGEKLPILLHEIDTAKVVKLDTWSMKLLSGVCSPNSDGGDNQVIKSIEMNNYFSMGIDAMIALGFHLARNANPQLFTGRTVNKLWYSKIGLEFITKDIVKLNKIIKIHIGEDELEIDKSIEGIIIMNLGSYAGGNDLWGKVKKSSESGFKKQFIDDEMLEILGVTSLTHLGSCLSGIMSPIKLAQGKNITITLKKDDDIDTAYQVDGEPYHVETNECTFKLNFQNQVNMLSPVDAKTKSSITKFEHNIVKQHHRKTSSSNNKIMEYHTSTSSKINTPLLANHNHGVSTSDDETSVVPINKTNENDQNNNGYTSPPSSGLTSPPLSHSTQHSTNHKVVLGGGIELLNLNKDK